MSIETLNNNQNTENHSPQQDQWGSLEALADQGPSAPSPNALPDDIFGDDAPEAPAPTPTNEPVPLPDNVLQGEPTHGALPDDIFPDEPAPLPDNVLQDDPIPETPDVPHSDKPTPPPLPDDIF